MHVLKQLLLLGGLTLLGFVLYVALFWAGIGASMTILFYRGLVLAAGAAVAVAVVGAWIGHGSNDSSLAVSAAVASFAFNVCFLVLLPVTVDRSVTVYLLSRIDGQQQAGVTAPELKQAFVSGYVNDMDAIGRRIDEQKRSGNIVVDRDGRVKLTDQGRRFMALSRAIARLFGTDPRFVGGADRSRKVEEQH